jgi:hypothetical protein
MSIKQAMLALTLVAPLTLDAGVIAGWDFNDQNLTVDQGSGTLTIDPSRTPGYNIRTGSDYYMTFGVSDNTSYFTIQVTGTGLSGFAVGYDANAIFVNPAQLWEYSVNSGASWSSAGLTQPGNIVAFNWTSYNVDFSSATSLNGASTVWLRNTFGNGAGQFDNIQVTAVPEPVNVAMGIFGLGLVGTTAGRRFLAKRAKKA